MRAVRESEYELRAIAYILPERTQAPRQPPLRRALRRPLMTCHPISQLVGYKQWADRGLYDVVGRNLDRLDAQDAAIMLRILDHIHVVDRIFQHHLRGLPHTFRAPRSEAMPDFQVLASRMREIDDWYASYVRNLPESDFDQPVDFVFTNGTPARLRRGEIILHVCLHGTYHRGNAGIVLQKNGIAPNDDRVTDFLETAA
jgi:uncharacterized damage-inducible protein DinB